MIFDKELMFVEKENMQNVDTGTLGRVLDLGAPEQGKGRPSWVALVFKSDTTATGDPDMSFALETSDEANFSTPRVIPLSLPTPVKKTDMKAGMCLCAPTPLCIERYVRLKLTTASPITCTGMEAGFVLDINS